MKTVIGITGHTSGIGKALYDGLSEKYDLLGFSRSNGYDISSLEGRQKVVSQVSEKCDIFINNAYSIESRDAQLNLLKEIYREWAPKPKLIIVNTSLLPVYQKWANFRTDLAEYTSSKKILIAECEKLLFDKNPCRVANIKLGFVDTKLTEKFDVPMMGPKSLVQFFQLVIENKLIHEMTLKI